MARNPVLACLAALAALPACSSEPVRLYELREAEVGSRDRQAYETLEDAVVLTNRFLTESSATVGWPAAETRVILGQTDILVELPGRGVEAMRIETGAWGDLRTMFGDKAMADEHGFTMHPDNRVGEDEAANNYFFRKDAEDMAAFLLRQAMIMREIRERGGDQLLDELSVVGAGPADRVGQALACGPDGGGVGAVLPGLDGGAGSVRVDSALGRDKRRLNSTVNALCVPGPAIGRTSEIDWALLTHLKPTRCIINFIRPHSVLRYGLDVRTWTQQAGQEKMRASLATLLGKHTRRSFHPPESQTSIWKSQSQHSRLTTVNDNSAAIPRAP